MEASKTALSRCCFVPEAGRNCPGFMLETHRLFSCLMRLHCHHLVQPVPGSKTRQTEQNACKRAGQKDALDHDNFILSKAKNHNILCVSCCFGA